jgi:hypothetical protein
MAASIENVIVRAKNLTKIWLIVVGVFGVSGCDVFERTALFAFTGESGTGSQTKSTVDNRTVDNRIESPDAAPAASLSQDQGSKRVSQVLSICDATPQYNPLPIAIIRFNGQESDFGRPLKAAIDRITTLKEEVGFELRVIIPSSYLSIENIDVVTPRQYLDDIKNSLIFLGVPELDMIYTAEDSRSNSVYEVHVFVLEICPTTLIEGSESLLVSPTPSIDEVRQPARVSIRA